MKCGVMKCHFLLRNGAQLKFFGTQYHALFSPFHFWIFEKIWKEEIDSLQQQVCVRIRAFHYTTFHWLGGISFPRLVGNRKVGPQKDKISPNWTRWKIL